MQTLKVLVVLAFFGFAGYLILSGFLWLGDRWDGVIDKTHENELVIRSEVKEIDVSQVEVQWYVPNRVHWLTKNGKFQQNMPEVEGRNNFRIFVKNKPVHTFFVNKPRAKRKYRYTVELRDNGDKVTFYFGWAPQFYSDDGHRGTGGHEMVDYLKERFIGKP